MNNNTVKNAFMVYIPPFAEEACKNGVEQKRYNIGKRTANRRLKFLNIFICLCANKKSSNAVAA